MSSIYDGLYYELAKPSSLNKRIKKNLDTYIISNRKKIPKIDEIKRYLGELLKAEYRNSDFDYPKLASIWLEMNY